MKLVKTMLLMTATVMLSTAALAATVDTEQSTAAAVKNLPDGSEVTVTGTVEDFDSRHPFTLRDSSGAISVNLDEAKPIVLRNGEKVTITGDVSKNLLGTEISATDVNIDTATNQ